MKKKLITSFFYFVIVSVDIRQTNVTLTQQTHRETELQSDLAKFHKLIEQLNQHKETLQQKVEARTEELKNNEDELKSITANVANLKAQVSSQDLR